MQQTLFIANWKMQKTLTQSIEFCSTNLTSLKKLSVDTATELVICPSFPSLYSLNEILADTPVHLGAQNCSPHESGAYTGQVSAESLKEAGCNYCIVGHSEQRMYNGVTDQDVAQAANNLCKNGIVPIICIGETKEQFEKNSALAVLEKQLDPVLSLLKNTKQPIIIAYEPVWAIGTGIIPETTYLKKIFEHLNALFEKIHSGPWRIIYGGSVSEQTIPSFKDISAVTGFLIGGASLDFQKFEKIVSLGK
ncbi:triose-phosphate isomerase [Candidatus Dependentiae bacterium]